MSTTNYRGTRSASEVQILDDAPTTTTTTGRIRGGSVLGGAVVGLGTLLLLELVLLTTGLSGASINVAGETGGSFVWDAIAGAIAFFVAGVVAGAAVPHRDVATGVLNGITSWATIILGTLILTGAVGTSIFGALGNVISTQQTAITNAASSTQVTAETVNSFQSATGWAALSFAISLALCALGGMIGSKLKSKHDTTATRA